MDTRRNFIRLAFGSLLGVGVLFSPLFSAARWVWAEGRKILTRETKRESLIHENPANLDTRDLEITPLEEFGTMGTTDKAVDLETWRLQVSGEVKKPLNLKYAQITALSPIERKVLLICPGFFASHGRWKGFSIKELLERADFDKTAARVVIEAKGDRTVRFPLADILSDKVFMAYQVNGKDLPRRHGFPLRVVAEDYYGSDWVKYADTITVEKA